ncbi:hypothetical protein VMCG_03011 [Cytospora schulzeri]|uniref:Uncharacterized protein n=1 Tax=Cytospora schulzeri TaxID=448051 RepID=A0A423WXW3_9PEZI|nr:hypothetical protein VMCG_03011 [Valsa malicola]
MPGRQSHGRSLMGNAKPASGKRNNQKSKTKARAHALDAFSIASKQKEEDDEDGDDGESLGSDAIDLADALDQSSDDDEGSQGDTESGSEEEASASETDEDDDDEDVDPSKLGELQNIIKGFAGADEDAEADSAPSSKQAISLQALGLTNVKDPLIKKPVKFIKKEEKAELSKKGSSKKLDVPLPRRQQDQLLRIAAQEKTNETLDRWNETVKHNRRADHLVFPLAHTLADAGLDHGELLPLTKKTAGNELEQTILSIMEESGLGPADQQKQKEQEKTIDANGEEQTISRADLKDLWAQRRRERELESREQARSKRIKKIKSKTYRRVHRKERLGEEEKLHAEMVASGEIDSEEEREAAHRRRALERVGARHKESKWAKMGSKVGRAAWDDDYRAGLTDMARKDEELRKRIAGKAGGAGGDEDDSDATSSSGDEDGNSRLLRDLNALDNDADEDAGPHGSLMNLKFMQRAEAQRKQANDELVAQIRRDLGSGSEDEDEDTEVQVGRRSFGLANKKGLPRAVKPTAASNDDAISNGTKAKPSKSGLSNGYMNDVSAADTVDAPSAPGAAGAWSSGKNAVSEKKKKKTAGGAPATELDLTSNIAVASKPASAPKSSKASKTKASSIITTGQQPVFEAGDDDSSDDEIHHPLAVRDIDLISRAFAGEDVVGEFEAEKDAIMSEDDEKVVDNTMPGWGAWAGEGISKRAQKRNKGKVMTKKEGIKKKDRKDAKLERVIVNEKRIRKNEKYLASQLPHPFESRQQYERSLRLPVGPEWMTKESFQDATKPRVIVKQGIIAPMAKPTI